MHNVIKELNEITERKYYTQSKHISLTDNLRRNHSLVRKLQTDSQTDKSSYE